MRLANDANCFALSEAADVLVVMRAYRIRVILGNRMRGWPSSMVSWSTDPEVLAENGDTTHCLGQRPMSTQALPVGVGAKDAWKRGSRSRHGRRSREDNGRDIYGRGDCRARHGLETKPLKVPSADMSTGSARGLAHVVNVVDPDVVVLGGGLSRLSHLYEQLSQFL